MKRVLPVFLAVFLCGLIFMAKRGGSGVKPDVFKEAAGEGGRMSGMVYETELMTNKSRAEIIKRWEELSEQGRKEGFYPLIIVATDALAEYLGENNPQYTDEVRQRMIDAAEKIDVKEFLAKRFKESVFPGDEHDTLGSFSAAEPNNELLGALYGEENIIIAKIPAKNPWELAVWAPMGGFNECPMPEEQAAVFKYWYEKYGAVPAVVSHDVWEMKVLKPVAANEEAEALAKEQFAFCSDIVYQGAGTIRGLASILKDSTVWFFWWD